MSLSMGRKIALDFAFSLAALLAIGLASCFNMQELSSDTNWITRTVEVQKKLQGLLAGLLQVESRSRGYDLIAVPGYTTKPVDMEQLRSLEMTGSLLLKWTAARRQGQS